jgi:hypothetical protein
MLRHVILVALAMYVCGLAAAQLRVENPQRLALPEEQMRLAYRMAIQEVIDEVSSKKGAKVPEFEITLKLGCRDSVTNEEYYDTEEQRQGRRFHNSGVICMESWDLEKFMYGVMRITERWLIPPDRYIPLLTNALRRVQAVAPVSVQQLQNSGGRAVANSCAADK